MLKAETIIEGTEKTGAMVRIKLKFHLKEYFHLIGRKGLKF